MGASSVNLYNKLAHIGIRLKAHNLKRVTDDFLRLSMGPFIPVPI
jgi:hypothetical protein